MEDFKFYMKRVVTLEDGTESVGEEQDMLTLFKGMQYKEAKGLNKYGKPKTYTETYAESSEADVFVTPEREQTDITLTLYFFAPTKTGNDRTDYDAADKIYHDFMEFVSGCKIIYRDNFRKRKVKMFLADATEPTTDRLYGIPYKEVQFKFKNIYGQSFPPDDTTF